MPTEFPEIELSDSELRSAALPNIELSDDEIIASSSDPSSDIVDSPPSENDSLIGDVLVERDSVGNLLLNVVEGFGNRVQTNITPSAQPTGQFDVSEQTGSLASDVATGVGDVLGDASTVGASTIAGAGIGSVVPGIGTAIGAGIGAGIGGGISLAQGIRSERENVRQQVLANGGSEEDANIAANRATPFLLLGELTDFVPFANIIPKRFRRAGLNKLTGKLAEDAAESTAKNVTKLGAIKNRLTAAGISAVAEGSGATLGASGAAAAEESVLQNQGAGEFLSNVASGVTDPQNIRQGIVEGIAGGLVGAGLGPGTQQVNESDIDAGIEVLSAKRNPESSEGSDTSLDDQAIEITDKLLEVEDSSNATNSQVIEVSESEGISSQELASVIQEQADDNVDVTVNENNNIEISRTDVDITSEQQSLIDEKASNSENINTLDQQIEEFFKLENPTDQEIAQRDLLSDQASELRRRNDEIDNSFQDINELRETQETQLESIETNSASITDVAQSPDTILFKPVLEESAPDVSAIRNATNTNPKSAIASFISKNFTSTRGRPEGILNSEIKAEGLQRSILLTAQRNIDILQKDINSVVKETVPREERSTQFDQINKDIQLYLIGEKDLDSLPEGVRDSSLEIRSNLDSLSLELVENGVVEGPLAQIFVDNLGSYVNRSYKFFDAKESQRGAKWLENVPDETINRAIGLFRRQIPRNENESTIDYDTRVLASIEAFLDDKSDSLFSTLSSNNFNKKNLSILQGRKSIPEEIRALWGERDGAIESYANSVLKMSNLLSSSTFLNDVKQDGLDNNYLFEEGSQPLGASTRISAEGNPRLAPLDGMRTFPEIAEVFDSFSPQEVNQFLKWFYTFNGLAKYAKTIASPITHIRNFTSNPYFLLSNGHIPLGSKSVARAAGTVSSDILPLGFKNFLRTNIPTPIIDAALNDTDQSNDSFLDLHKRYLELGVYGDEVRSRELLDVAKDSLIGEVDSVSFTDNRVQKALKKTTSTLAHVYQAEDGFWKIVAFEKELDRLKRSFPERDNTELEQEAAQIIRDTMPTYSLIPEAVQALRNVPFIAPFVSFSSEVIRTNINILRRSTQEIQDPKTRATGVKRLAGQTASHLIGGFALSKFACYISGCDEDLEESIRLLAAPWDANAELSPLPPDEQGRPRFINTSYSNPNSMFKRFFIALNRELPDDERTLGAFKELLEPFLGEEIFSKAVREAVSNTTSTGGRVYNDADTERDKLQKQIAHVGAALTPGAVDQLSRVAEAYYGVKTASGEPRDFRTELFGLLSGQRIVTLDPKRSLRFKGSDFVRTERDVTQLFSGIAKSQKDVTDEELTEAFQKMQEARERNFDKIVSFRNAAIKLGVSAEEANNILKEQSRVGKNKILQISRDQFTQPRLSKDFQKQIARIPGRRDQIERLFGKEVFK